MFCEQCGTKNDDSAKFCSTCGTAVAAAASSPTQSQATPNVALNNENRRVYESKSPSKPRTSANSNLIECGKCGAQIAKDTDVCLQCGGKTKYGHWNSVVGFAVCVIVIYYYFSERYTSLLLFGR